MRNPDRIDVIIEDLRKVWKASPDQRLTQLIMNHTRTSSGAVLSTSAFWNTEDWAVHQNLKDTLNGLQENLVNPLGLGPRESEFESRQADRCIKIVT